MRIPDCKLTLSFAALAFASSTATIAQTNPDRTMNTSQPLRNAGVSLDLYRRMSARSGNLFFSPLSLTSALSMTYAGARGDTAAEMAKTLHLGADAAQTHADYAALKSALDARSAQSHGEIALSVANSLWMAMDYDVKPEFLSLIARQYHGIAEPLDFQHHPETAVARINAWIAEQTRARIRNLLSRNDVPPDTKMILTNAVYFKAPWEDQFSESLTIDGPFTNASGKVVKAKMMRQTLHIHYAHFDQVSVAELPYKGDRLAMMVLLPDKSDGLAGLEKQLTPNMLAHAVTQLKSESVNVTVPKLHVECKYELTGDLEALGIRRAFSREADFTGITDRKPLFIGAVIHQTFLDVDENGTEAAAATAVTALAGSAVPQRPVELRLDHPFLLLIRDRPTGTILFMGRITDPTVR